MQRKYDEDVKKQPSLDELPSFCSLLCSKNRGTFTAIKVSVMSQLMVFVRFCFSNEELLSWESIKERWK